MITPKEKYENAKRSAFERGIDWQFDFKTWIEWWGDDFDKRGPRKGQLTMARFNDQGPYHPSNVEKKTVEENVREMRIRLKGNYRPVGTFKHSEKTKIQMSQSHLGKKRKVKEIYNGPSV